MSMRYIAPAKRFGHVKKGDTVAIFENGIVKETCRVSKTTENVIHCGGRMFSAWGGDRIHSHEGCREKLGPPRQAFPVIQDREKRKAMRAIIKGTNHDMLPTAALEAIAAVIRRHT